MPMHEHAWMAAQAAEAAGLQGKFCEMHDKLYENQTTWTPAKDLVPIFVDYAKQIGVDPDRFMKDLNGEQVAQRIFQDGKRVHALGLNGTPSFFVNGKEAKGDQWKPDGMHTLAVLKDPLRHLLTIQIFHKAIGIDANLLRVIDEDRHQILCRRPRCLILVKLVVHLTELALQTSGFRSLR